MLPKSLKSLVKSAGIGSNLALASALGAGVALFVPVLIVLAGSVINALLEGQRESLSPWLPSVNGWFSSGTTPLAQATILLSVSLVGVLVVSMTLLFFYRQVQKVAVDFEVNMIRQLRDHAHQLAIARTISAQRTSLVDSLDYHLPRVRSTLARWWRTYPRHLIQMSSALVVAALIQPLLLLLTLIAAGLVFAIYRFIDKLRRTSLPVVRERAEQERGILVDLSVKGPLLESTHDSGTVKTRFDEQLEHYRQDAYRSLTSSSWKTPTLILVIGGLSAVFALLVAIQIQLTSGVFSIASAITFAMCIGAAVVSASRLQRSAREVRTIESATEELHRFMGLPLQKFNSADLKEISAIRQMAELDHVTLQDSHGRKLLEDVSIVFRPGSLVGIVSSQRLQSHALVELLMGFGRPVSGRLIIDGNLVTDLNPQSLAKCSHWVSANGALITGTVRENLTCPSKAVEEQTLQQVIVDTKLENAIQKLSDGVATLIGPKDDRLLAEDLFRIGLARAAIRHPSVVVIEEPDSRHDSRLEQESFDAMRSLVRQDAITIVLPQRLTTLRQCDLVVMMHEHRIADSGTHAELLQRNELYRHLNYLRYNPYRGMAT